MTKSLATRNYRLSGEMKTARSSTKPCGSTGAATSLSAILDIYTMTPTMVVISWVTHSPECLCGQSCHFSFADPRKCVIFQVTERGWLRGLPKFRRILGILITNNEVLVAASQQKTMHHMFRATMLKSHHRVQPDDLHGQNTLRAERRGNAMKLEIRGVSYAKEQMM